MVDVELGSGVGAGSRRRRRSAEERRRVVEETLLAGSSVARVAQRHGVNANQVFQWRRLYQSGLLGGPAENVQKLLPVSVTEDAVPAKPEPAEVSVAPTGRQAGRSTSSCARECGSAWRALLILRWFARC